MSYLRASSARTPRRTLGLLPIRTNGGSQMVRVRFAPLPRVVTPAPAPVTAPISTMVPVKLPPVPAPAPATIASTPVPVNFPRNQFFVASDGSVWEYSGAQGTWINTGTPFNVAAPSASPATTTTSLTPSGTPATPVNVTVAPAAAPSGYQSILDWLSQHTLIASVPNWGVALAAAAALVLLKSRFEGGRR